MTIAEKLNSVDSSFLSEDLISDQIISSHQYKELYDQLDNQLTLLYEKEIEFLYEQRLKNTMSSQEKHTMNQLSSITDSMDHLLGAAGLNDYEVIARIAKAFQIDHVHDIGCNLGIQGKLFHDRRIKYTGYDTESTFEFPLLKQFNENIECVQKEYPFLIHTSKGKHMLISRLCLGYFKKDDETTKRIIKEFDIVFLICSDHSFIQKFDGYRIFKYMKRSKQWKETNFHDLDGSSDFLLMKDSR